MKLLSRLTLAVAVLGLLVGARPAHAKADARACVPGIQVECSCLGGAKAFQVCAPDGASFQPCQCAAAAPAVPVAPPVAPSADVERTRQLGAEITQLRQERSQYGLTVPVLTMLGGAVLLGGGIGVIAAGSGTDCHSDSVTGEECFSTYDTGATAGGVAMALVGAGAITLGAVWMVKRLGPRRELGNQINAKESELRLIRQTSRIGFAPTRDGGGLFTLAGSF